MSEAFIVRRCGGNGGGSGSANPRGGAVLHVLSSSIYTQSVSVEAEGYSMTLTSEQAYPVRDFPNISHSSAIDMDLYSFPIQASWLSKPSSAPRSDYDVTITVHDETANNAVVVNLYPYDISLGEENTDSIRTSRCQEHVYIVAPFPILLDPAFGLNMACEITNNNSNLLEKKYDDSSSQILKGPSGSVDADITCFEDGGFDLTIPGNKYTSMYVAGSASGNTSANPAKVCLYDTLGNLQARIDLGSNTHTSVSIPSGTSGLRLNITGKNVIVSTIQFS